MEQIKADCAPGCTQARAEKEKFKLSRSKRNQAICGIAFLAPSILFFLVFTIVPLVMAFYVSLTDFDLVEMTFIGFENFEYIFQNLLFLHTLVNILVYAAMSVPLTVICSLLVANLVNQKIKGVKAFRALYYLPAVTSGVAVAFVWKWMYNQRFGLFNTLFGTNIAWTGSQSYFALFCIVIITTWSGIGGNMLIYLAGLKGISPDLYEAADIDGANGVQKLWYITVPMLRPTTFFILTMTLIGSFQLFDVVQMISDSNYYMTTPMVYIYGQIRKLEGGRASAMSLVLFVVIMAVTFLTQRLTKETN